MYVTIQDLKKHLNVDHDEDDAYIRELEAVAEDSIAVYLNAPLTDYITEGECSHDELQPSIRHAIRLLVGTWYANRENVAFSSSSEIPFSVSALLRPLKKF